MSHNISLIARLKHYTVRFLVQFFKPLSHFVRTVPPAPALGPARWHFCHSCPHLHLLPFYLSAQPLIHPSKRLSMMTTPSPFGAGHARERERGREGATARRRGGPIDRVPNWTAPRRGGEYVWPCGGVRLLLSASSLHPSLLPTRPLPPLFPTLASLPTSLPPALRSMM